MPFYDLKCENCKTEYNIKATMEEKTQNRISCPECGSTDMKTIYSAAPAYIKSRKDSAPVCPNSASCGAGAGCRFRGT